MSLVAQLAGSPAHSLTNPNALPMEVAIGMLLIGGVALGPTAWRRQQVAVRPATAGADLSQPI
jgi:hypothetical protein